MTNNFISTPATSIIYIGTRKNTERTRCALRKAVREGYAPKPNNAQNAFLPKKTRRVLIDIPCGLFMTEDTGVPARLSQFAPVIVLARTEGNPTKLYIKGYKIF